MISKDKPKTSKYEIVRYDEDLHDAEVQEKAKNNKKKKKKR